MRDAPLVPPPEEAERLRIGVLASQGGFAAHVEILQALGAEASEVRASGEIEALDALVMPGGESTTISKAIERDGLEPAIRSHHASGKPILGTCAGMIVLAKNHLGLLDATCRRNAFGRQLASFEADLDVKGAGPDPMRAVFIRAPWVEEAGPGVEVLAEIEGRPVVVRQDAILACAFHPELTGDSRLHALLMAMTASAEANVRESIGEEGENG